MIMADKEKDEYPLSPMHKHFKEVVWVQLVREHSQSGGEDGPIHRMKWLFQQQDFPCDACHSSEKVKFMVLPTGVYRSCDNEGFTEKVEAIDYGERGYEAILLENYVCVTNEEAIAVIRRYKQEKIYLDEESRIRLPEYKLPRKTGRKPKKE
jgi:hypothetical protein